MYNYQHLRTHTCDTAIRRPDVQSLPTPADCFTDVIIIRYSTWQASRLRDSARIAFLAPCTQKPHTHVRAPPAQRTAQHAFTDCCDTHSHRYTTLLLTHRPTTQQPTQAKATNEDTARASPARLALRNEPRVRRTPGLGWHALCAAVSELLLDPGLCSAPAPGAFVRLSRPCVLAPRVAGGLGGDARAFLARPRHWCLGGAEGDGRGLRVRVGLWLLFWRVRRGGWMMGGWGSGGGTYGMVWYVRRGFVDGGGEAGLGTWGMLEASLGRRDEGQAVRV